VSHSTAVEMAGVAVAIAKWLNYQKSTRRNWLDVPIVLELQDLEGEYAEIYELEKRQHEAEKWPQKKLTHKQARQVVQYLQKLCAPNYGKHDKETGEFLSHGTRRVSAVARAWQTYLLVKILVYCPVRQEELRNWKLGETLFRKEDEQGNPYYVVKLKEHKRSSITGKTRHYRLPAILTEDLDLWVYKWRPLIVKSVQTLDESKTDYNQLIKTL
jgi:integrase